MIIEKAEIAAKLAKIKGIIPVNSAVPGLEGVLFKNRQLTAYNLELGITARLNTDSDEQFIIPRKAISMIDELPAGPIDITESKNSLMIRTGSIKNRFSTFPTSDFPEVPDMAAGAEPVTVDSVKLTEGISSVLYAVAEKNTRIIQTGILFDAREDILTLVGCDGCRLAVNTLPLKGTFKFVVPKKNMKEILALKMRDDIEITFDGKRAVFRSDEYSVYTRLFEGEYMNYKAAVPHHTRTTCINSAIFAAGVHRALICVGDVKAPVLLEFIESSLSLSLNSAISDYAESMVLDGSVDMPLMTGFNADYLYDALKSFGGKDINMGIGQQPNTPMVLRAGTLTAMVLPVRLKT